MSENSSKNSKSLAKILRAVGLSLALCAWAIGAFYLAQFVLAGGLLWALQFFGVFDYNNLNKEVQSVVGFAIVFSLTLLIVIFVPWVVVRYKTTLKELGLTRLLSWSDLLVGPVAYVPYIALSIIIISAAKFVFPDFDHGQARDVGFSALTNSFGMIMAFLALVVIAPIAEEVLFRGYLYGKIKAYVGAIAAALIVSVCFGAVHGQWNVGLDVFALSIVMCGLRELTGSIWAGVLLHMTKNAIAFVAIFTVTF